MIPPKAGSATRAPFPKTHVPPIDHALKTGALQNDRAVRIAHNAIATMQLLMQGLTPHAQKELFNLQASALTQLKLLQMRWIRDWRAWYDDADRIAAANTLSKMVEMDSNIVARAAQLLGTQLTSLVALQENIEVDYAYLIEQLLA